MSSLRCPHACGSFLFCREFELLHLSRTKRRNFKCKGRSQNRSFASGSLLTLLVRRRLFGSCALLQTPLLLNALLVLVLQK